MVAKIRATVGKIRTQIKSMEVGVEFEGEGDEGEESEGRSNLELKNPENLEELAVMTEVDMFFNVTDNESDDRAFLMYIGNEVGWKESSIRLISRYLLMNIFPFRQEGTHTMMPHTSTDDFLAVELVEGGRLKVSCQ